MKFITPLVLIAILLVTTCGCRTTRHINKAIAARDTAAVVVLNQSSADSVKMVKTAIENLNRKYIDFKSFNAKIKVEYEDSKGKQPDITAIVRIMKDSAIWISLSATLFNIEVYRMYINRDSVILMNTREKEVQYRSLGYLQEITEIPFDYETLQNLFIGNPIFWNNKKVVSIRRTENHILVLAVGDVFKHLLTLSADNNFLMHSKLDDLDVARNRTADITYGDYENKSGFDFSTYREITVSEKNKLDIRLNYKQYEFNKDLSVSFRVPKNYKIK